MNLLLKRIRSIYAYYERKQAQKQDGFSVVFLYFPNWIKKESRLLSGETQKQRKLQHEPHGDGLAQHAHHARFILAADVDGGIGGVGWEQLGKDDVARPDREGGAHA